jgi:hypothetical protein
VLGADAYPVTMQKMIEVRAWCEEAENCTEARPGVMLFRSVAPPPARVWKM